MARLLCARNQVAIPAVKFFIRNIHYAAISLKAGRAQKGHRVIPRSLSLSDLESYQRYHRRIRFRIKFFTYDSISLLAVV